VHLISTTVIKIWQCNKLLKIYRNEVQCKLTLKNMQGFTELEILQALVEAICARPFGFTDCVFLIIDTRQLIHVLKCVHPEVICVCMCRLCSFNYILH